jgi:ABC-type multidrug transport system ATPase subunit
MKIEISKLSKSYGWSKALEDVSLEIESGQIVAILGPNGAGKTTLLRCLAGLVVPNQGEIRYDGQLFGRHRLDLRERFVFLPDYPFLSSSFDAVRQIGLTLELYGKEQKDVEVTVVGLLHEFDLISAADTLLSNLSRGQAYKAGLVSLLAVDPDLWLLDEPMASGMDPHGLMALKRHARLAAKRGRTVVYSTQILDIAESFSDKVCILHEGQVHAFDGIDQLRQLVTDGGSVLEELFRRLRETDQ